MTLPRHSVLLVAAAVLAVAGSVWLARAELADRRAAFETDARIAHRLLSQRAVQHEAILQTLALLQPGSAGDAAPEQRLPALYPQVQRVLRRDRDTAWPDAALAAAEAESRRLKRAVLAAPALAQGRYTVLLAAEPASFALVIDADAPLPEWPYAANGATRAVLALGADERVLAPGTGTGSGPWSFSFAKHLAADSQPFDLRASLAVGWGALPWGRMLLWCVAVAGVAVAIGAGQRQASERRRAEELLRLGQVGRLNAMGELAAGMAHELNQPLTALLASTQAARRLLADEPPDLEQARSAMARGVQQARRASEVLGRLRASVERPMAAALQPLPLDPALRRALDLLEPEWRRLGVTPRIDCQPPTLAVQAEPVALEQIVHNLLANALHALAEVPAGERRLALQARPDGASGVLAVQDSGPGLAPEVLPRVFEPFFTTRAGGLGLGLSLCETLAAGMGGALSVRNLAPRGAEFRLTLPLAA